jgi:hypothetical protein
MLDESRATIIANNMDFGWKKKLTKYDFIF